MNPPLEQPAEHGMRELEIAQHGHHERVEYLAKDPGEQGEIYLDEPPCPRCHRGTLTREFGRTGEMLTCRNGCGARFWLDREPLEGQQRRAPE